MAYKISSGFEYTCYYPPNSLNQKWKRYKRKTEAKHIILSYVNQNLETCFSAVNSGIAADQPFGDRQS
jgi:hypothetical protein